MNDTANRVGDAPAEIDSALRPRLDGLAKLIGAVALLLVVAVVAVATVDRGEDRRHCFPAAQWGGDDDKRPCGEVVGIYEDGSAVVKVTNADGTERFETGVGAVDR